MTPIWGPVEDQDNPGLVARAFYLTEEHQFRVEVEHNAQTHTKIISAAFEPIFGIDVVDMECIQTTAVELADELLLG